MARTVLLGLDAGDWSLIQQLLERGDLPNLASIKSASAEMVLTHPLPFTERVWEVLLTGRNPPSTSVVFDPASYRTYHRGATSTAPFFSTPTSGSVVAFDVPWMSLAHRVDGAQIAGWGEANKEHPPGSHPHGLLDEIESRFGRHPITSLNQTWHNKDRHSMAAFTRALVEGVNRRAQIWNWLISKWGGADLFITAVSELHLAGEAFWHGMDSEHPLAGTDMASVARDSLIDVYRAVDESLSFLKSFGPETNVVVFSLQGMKSNFDLCSTVLLPEMLHRLHFGAPFLRNPARGWDPQRPAGFPHTTQGWSEYIGAQLSAPALTRAKRRLKRVASRAGLPSGSGTRKSPDAGSHSVDGSSAEAESGIGNGDPVVPLTYQVACRYRRFWRQMRAFALPTYSDGRVRINLRGREARGIVDLADYSQACDEVEEMLRTTNDPRTGRSVIEEVFRPRRRDPLDPENPEADLIVIWSEPTDAFEHPESGRIGPFPFDRTGGHVPRGFALLSGPSTDRENLGERTALDLAPTVLALMGHSGSERLEGRPAVGIRAG